MRRVVICFICATLMLSGCYSAKMVAPSDSDVKVLTETDNTEFKKEIRLWYVLFGAVPINEPTSAEIIEKYQLTEVRVTTKHKFLDYLIGAFTGIASIVPMTMVIEGNTQASNADAAMTNPQDAEQLRQIAADLKASADQQ
ncbi:MAG: hypothetical protein H6695_18565 [Deferribacteres bacterium]|nr:hypothetical protein [candidate division KSB1 bacterium]MCB9512189.1 hypothetical protein [Deferribacteres bacterium]